jgi:hypothetical protein
MLLLPPSVYAPTTPICVCLCVRTLRVQVLHHWREWAPGKRSRRRRLRDAQATLRHRARQRLWAALSTYTVLRRSVRQRKATAVAHFRRTCLHNHLLQWASALELRAHLEDASVAARDSLLARRAVRMLRWWRMWLTEQRRRQEATLAAHDHMEALSQARCGAAAAARSSGRSNCHITKLHAHSTPGRSNGAGLLYMTPCPHALAATAHRCIAKWRRWLVRRQQLRELEWRASQGVARVAARSALRAWHQVRDWTLRHSATPSPGFWPCVCCCCICTEGGSVCCNRFE